VRTLTSVRENLVVAVVSGTRRQSGWTAPQSLLAERIFQPLRTIGPAALIGLSNDSPSTSHIPRAFKEAGVALDFASVADRVMPYSQVSFQQMLVRVARDNLRSAMPAWIDGFLRADLKAHGKLSTTLRAYADNNMNVLQTAKALSIHPNTVYSRTNRIGELTDCDPLSFHGLTELLFAIECSGDRAG
jgi:sugar diacid utilization regulator